MEIEKVYEMISVVCVYNNKNVFEVNLLASLNKQDVEYELIDIDNTGGKFKSAPQALNWGGQRAKGDYILFIHQDVEFWSCSWIKDLEITLGALPDLGVAGVAGLNEEGDEVGFIKDRSCIFGKPLASPVITQTLDELLLIIPRNIFNKVKFDERIDDWHIYGVDYCLTMKRRGLKAYVIPAFVWHNSSTSNLLGLEKYQRYLWHKHRWHFFSIFTTCGCFGWKHFFIDIPYRLIRKFFGYDLIAAQYNMSTLGQHLANEFKDCSKILYVDISSKASLSYNQAPVLIKTEALPYCHQEKNKEIDAYYVTSSINEFPIFDKILYEGALLSLDFFDNSDPLKLIEFINKIESHVEKKIMLYQILKSEPKDKFDDNLAQSLLLLGYLKKDITIRDAYSRSKRVLLSFSKTIVVKTDNRGPCQTL